MPVLNGVIPVFLVVGLGALARRLGWADADFARQLNRVIYYLAVPALLLELLGRGQDGSVSWQVVAASCLATIVGAGLALVVAMAARVPRRHVGVLIQAATRGNLVFIAFPVLFAASGAEALRVAAILAAILIPLQNLVAVGALGASSGLRGWRMVTLLVLNPIVLGVIGGILWRLSGWEGWGWLNSFLGLLGGIAMPGALLAVGMQLQVQGIRGHQWLAGVASVLKLAVVPALGLAAMVLLGVTGLERLVGLMLLAAPTAVASTVVAQEMGGDVELAGSLVMASTLGALPAFVLWGLVA